MLVADCNFSIPHFRLLFVMFAVTFMALFLVAFLLRRLWAIRVFSWKYAAHKDGISIEDVALLMPISKYKY